MAIIFPAAAPTACRATIMVVDAPKAPAVISPCAINHAPHPTTHTWPKATTNCGPGKRHAAIAMDNARLHEQVQRLAIVEERERIGKDLHDTLIQAIYAVGRSLDDVPEMMDDEPDEARRRVERRGALPERGPVGHRAGGIEHHPHDLFVDR